AKGRAATRARDRYARLLRRWTKRRPRPKDLSRKERGIYRAIRRLRYPFSRAARNVRAQQGLREKFREGIIRSGLYIDRMRRIFRAYGLPEDLTILPHVESSFNYRAYSRFGAAGIWQFTRSTGRRYLKINYSIDERLDPILSTHAAARLLRKNHQELRAWPLAITAYNHGRAGIQRAVRKVGTKHLPTIIRNYDGRVFGFASKNFYAEFLAARIVVKNSRRFFGAIRMRKPHRYEEFRLPDYISLDTLVRNLPLNRKEVREYNPALRKPILRGDRYIPKGYALRVPQGRLKRIRRAYASLDASLKRSRQKPVRWYRVARGDTLGNIARRFRTSIRDLVAANNIRDPAQIRAGNILSIPGRKKTRSARATRRKKGGKAASPPLRVASSRAAPAAPAPPAAKAPKAPASPTPKAPKTRKTPAGETPDSRAAPRRPAVVPVAETRPAMPDKRELSEVRVTGKSGKRGWTRVEPEETLGHFAEWLNIKPQVLRRLNRLRRKQSIRLGQKLILTFQRVTPEKFEQRRLEYHKGLEDDFFENYRVVRTERHTVRKGESLWDLALNVYEVPFWLMARYNPGLSGSGVTAGEDVTFPVVVPRGQKVKREN
ncbi:MAG: LysM peptidoglycan-binding domain-containing protein, partial [Nitrospinota bacterium]